MPSSCRPLRKGIGAILLGLMSGAVVAQTAEQGSEGATSKLEVSAELQQLVDAYFEVQDREERQALVASIEKVAGHDARLVAEALKHVDVWSAAPEGPVNMFFAGRGRPRVAAVFEIPLGYTSDQAYPAVICIPDSGLEPEVMLTKARQYLGEFSDDFIVVATTAEIAGTFHQNKRERTKLRTLVKMLRKRLHTDTNRLYVLGVGTGADAAWLAAIRHPDLFAGVIAINGYPNVPYPRQSYPLLLQSLRDVPTLSMWNAPAADSSETAERAAAVASHNRAIARLAADAFLPFRIMEMPATAPLEDRPPVDALSEILARDRAPGPQTVERWFRYPSHGRSAWLRQRKFAGDVWDDAAISIVSGADVDRHDYVTSVLREKMAHIGGRIDGQTITIEVSRTAGVALALPLGVLDPAKKVTVICNGRTRHDSRLPPAIDTILADAYEQWEFQAPAAVRLSLSVRSGN